MRKNKTKGWRAQRIEELELEVEGLGREIDELKSVIDKQVKLSESLSAENMRLQHEAEEQAKTEHAYIISWNRIRDKLEHYGSHDVQSNDNLHSEAIKATEVAFDRLWAKVVDTYNMQDALRKLMRRSDIARMLNNFYTGDTTLDFIIKDEDKK